MENHETSELTEKISQKMAGYLKRKKTTARGFNASQLAQKIGVSPTYMHFLLKGKKLPTLERAYDISSALELSSFEREEFLDLVIQTSARAKSEELATALEKGNYSDVYLEHGIEVVSQIKGWFHFAIMEMTTCENFKPDVAWIARRLKLPLLTVSAAVDRLFRYGFLCKTESGRWKKREIHFAIKNRQSDQTSRAIQKQMIDLAADFLQRKDPDSFAARKITGVTMAVDSHKLSEVKKEIDSFKRRIAQHMTSGECTEVYQLNIQLFPLTERVDDTN